MNENVDLVLFEVGEIVPQFGIWLEYPNTISTLATNFLFEFHGNYSGYLRVRRKWYISGRAVEDSSRRVWPRENLFFCHFENHALTQIGPPLIEIRKYKTRKTALVFPYSVKLYHL